MEDHITLNVYRWFAPTTFVFLSAVFVVLWACWKDRDEPKVDRRDGLGIFGAALLHLGLIVFWIPKGAFRSNRHGYGSLFPASASDNDAVARLHGETPHVFAYLLSFLNEQWSVFETNRCISVLTVLVAGLVGARMSLGARGSQRGLGTLCALSLALFPVQLRTAGTDVSLLAASFCLLLMWWSIIEYGRGGRRLWMTAAALWCALACMSHLELFFFAPAVGVMVWSREVGWGKEHLSVAFASAVLTSVACLPHLIRLIPSPTFQQMFLAVGQGQPGTVRMTWGQVMSGNPYLLMLPLIFLMPLSKRVATVMMVVVVGVVMAAPWVSEESVGLLMEWMKPLPAQMHGLGALSDPSMTPPSLLLLSIIGWAMLGRNWRGWLILPLLLLPVHMKITSSMWDCFSSYVRLSVAVAPVVTVGIAVGLYGMLRGTRGAPWSLGAAGFLLVGPVVKSKGWLTHQFPLQMESVILTEAVSTIPEGGALFALGLGTTETSREGWLERISDAHLREMYAGIYGKVLYEPLQLDINGLSGVPSTEQPSYYLRHLGCFSPELVNRFEAERKGIVLEPGYSYYIWGDDMVRIVDAVRLQRVESRTEWSPWLSSEHFTLPCLTMTLEESEPLQTPGGPVDVFTCRESRGPFLYEEGVDTRFLHPTCRAFEDRYTLEPVREMSIGGAHAAGASSWSLPTQGPVGLYRITGVREE